MELRERIEVLEKLGDLLQAEDQYRDAVLQRTFFHNRWLTIDNQNAAIEHIADRFLDSKELDAWLHPYLPHLVERPPKKIGIVLPGNIPLVGFHDLLCIFVAGHRAVIKLSDKDKYFIPYLLKLLAEIDPRTEQHFEIVPILKDFDAVIATGSNNSYRYFETYFAKYPNILRKNRNGIAVLNGEETEDELLALGRDIFQYFGLGCRNVSKLYVPQGYDFDPLLKALDSYKEIILHEKYKNNFDYNYAMYVLNREPHFANSCLFLLEKESIASRIACVHFEYYQDSSQLKKTLDYKEKEIQCIVAKKGLLEANTIPFGKAQQPELFDYADGIDTLEFLLMF